jgi:hypothetical protein
MNLNGQNHSRHVCEAFACNELATIQIEVQVGLQGKIPLNLCKNCVPLFTVRTNKERKLFDWNRITSDEMKNSNVIIRDPWY